MYNSKKYFSFKKSNFSEEAVLQTSWALQSVNLPGENYNNDAKPRHTGQFDEAYSRSLNL